MVLGRGCTKNSIKLILGIFKMSATDEVEKVFRKIQCAWCRGCPSWAFYQKGAQGRDYYCNTCWEAGACPREHRRDQIDLCKLERKTELKIQSPMIMGEGTLIWPPVLRK